MTSQYRDSDGLFDMETSELRWFEAMKIRGHMPRMDEDGKIDIFFLESDYHNGPGCEVCHWSCCIHCWGETPLENIPPCSVIETTATQVNLLEYDDQGAA